MQYRADERTHLNVALEIVPAMQSRGMLAPADAWMPDELRRMPAQVEAQR